MQSEGGLGLVERLQSFFDTNVFAGFSALLYALLILAITVIAARVVGGLMKKLVARRRVQDAGAATMLSFGGYALVFGIYLAGIFVLVSGIPALNSALTKLLAAGGVLAVVGGLAAQEALGSVVSGLMILLFKPFGVGDVVRYLENDIGGVIEEITLHHTTIRTYENKRVIVPNSRMNSAIIENADYGDSRVCVFLEFALTPESDSHKAEALIRQAVLQNPRYLDIRTPAQKQQGEAAVEVLVLSISGEATTLRCSLWAKDNSAAFALKCEVLRQLKDDFSAAGIELSCSRVQLGQIQAQKNDKKF